MDSLNSSASRKTAPSQHMRSLEKAITAADQRIRMRRTAVVNAQITMVGLFAVPFASYMIYNFFAAGGVMHNYKSSSGAYMNFAMNWMMKPRSATQIYRPEIDMAQQSSPLVAYTKKIEAQRAEGTLEENVHHPTTWH